MIPPAQGDYDTLRNSQNKTNKSLLQFTSVTQYIIYPEAAKPDLEALFDVVLLPLQCFGGGRRGDSGSRPSRGRILPHCHRLPNQFFRRSRSHENHYFALTINPRNNELVIVAHSIEKNVGCKFSDPLVGTAPD